VKLLFGIATLLGMLPAVLIGQSSGTPVSVHLHDEKGSFALIKQNHPSAILIDTDADSAVKHVADSFAADLERVSGHTAARLNDVRQADGPIVIIGVLNHSAAIDGLVRAGKIHASDIEGVWEAYRQIVVDHPFPNVARALVIVGADRRGAVFGTYDISEKIGVSA
jgi:hypothetical protein